MYLVILVNINKIMHYRGNLTYLVLKDQQILE